MRAFVRILVGGLIAAVVLWVAVALFGLLAIWSPWPRSWWAHHATWVIGGSEALALLPLVITLGYFLRMLFKQNAALSALASTVLAIAVAYADVFRQPELFGPTFRLTWTLFLSFLIGPPLVVLVLTWRRSNSRSSGPGGIKCRARGSVIHG